MARYTLADLAQQFEAPLVGNADLVVEGLCSLKPGQAGCLAFVGTAKAARDAADSRASALIVRPAEKAILAQRSGLLSPHPQWLFAKIAALFAPEDRPPVGIDPSALIDPSAVLEEGVRIAAGCVIGAGAHISAGTALGAACVIGAQTSIGPDGDIGARVVVGPRVRIGARALVLPGAVIGSRGFGNVHDGQRWHAVPQLGTVLIGDDVEIGANSCIDRGALEDTVIEDNVRIDNLCQIAHNVRIGAGSALAAQVGVAGSTTVGRGCMLGGQVGLNGHIQLADGVIVNGGSSVFQSIDQAGQYASGLPVMPAMPWRRLAVLLRTLEARLKTMDKRIRG